MTGAPARRASAPPHHGRAPRGATRARAGRLVVGAIGVGCATLAVAAGARHAEAQRVDPRRPAVFVVGPAGGPSPTLRGDARRTGFARDVLPSGPLRIAWRKTIGVSIEQPALAGADGTIAIVTPARGDVVFLDGDGDEQGRVATGSASVGPATMTSDGTVVFATGAGDAVGARRTSARPRFVSRVGGERNGRAAPLSLDDGGVVIATATDLVVLDAEGHVRSRVSLPEAPSAALLASGEQVIAVTTSGAVYGWTPGGEPLRMGSFGAPVDGGAALVAPSTLIAVIEGNHLVELDLARGALTSRAVAAHGLYLGPPAVRPVADGGAVTALLAQTPSGAFVVGIDPSGQEIARAPIAILTPPVLADGGAAPLVAPAHAGVLVDARGAVAFVAPEDGHVGVVMPDGTVDTLGELICTRTGRSTGVAGLTALGRGAFAVTCESGAVAKITGREAELLRRGATPGAMPARPSSSAAPLRSRDVD